MTQIFKIMSWLGASVTAIIFISGCSHTVKRASLPDNQSPSQMLNTINSEQKQAEQSLSTVLSRELYENGVESKLEFLEEKDEDSPDISEMRVQAEYAVAYFRKARQNSSEQSAFLNPVMNARAIAEQAGATKYISTRKTLSDIDEDLANYGPDFRKNIDHDELVEFQKRYQELQKQTVASNYLKRAKHTLEKAETQEMDEVLPNTYTKAEEAYELAQNAIVTNPNSSKQFAEETLEAYRSVELLRDAMTVVTSQNQEISESAALQIVRKERDLERAQRRAEGLDEHLDDAHLLIADLGLDLMNTTTDLNSSESKVQTQEILEKTRSLLDGEETQAFQKGSKIIVRFGSLDFDIGSSSLSPSAKEKLDKFKQALSEVGVTSMTIEGHTDSTGSSELNKKLSRDRAKAVAEHLSQDSVDFEIKTKGMAASEPLASNDSANGRELNRRVDIIIETSTL